MEEPVPQAVGLLQLTAVGAAPRDRAAITRAAFPAATPDRRVPGPDPLELHGPVPADPLSAALS